MNTKSRAISLIVLAVALVAAASPVAARPADDDWEIMVAPYLLGAFMNGTVGVRGVETTIDVSASDIFSKLKMGFNGYFQAKKGKWGFASDIIYMNLGTYQETPHTNFDTSQGAYSFVGIRELNERLDLMFGVRWNVITGDVLFFDARPPLIPANTKLSMKKQWVDPLVGINWNQPLGEKLLFNLGFNLAGFGAGAKIVVDCFPTLQYRVGKRAWLGLGYRLMYTNYEKNYVDGALVQPADAFKYDVVSQGPVVGMAFRF
ncbi:MAG: hypothetical protein KA419_19890 [Acidobacteria bacterium]|nr:hypothetical protein [Acidobacteriota bacterium]